ncbi:putative ABC transporter permease [Floccifex sp.]|uniref:putative ABC transporter permease n=1 Tax=Floccifex sp. TaxID=2815810 RepID=UPI002A74885C|nr:hypothetical protein [Floccifex sp.]MDD7281584.1 hypothetical protein [Erysipelotrichaceae bacterium]MDY2958167.1 hypothetical protein [Floccifex sp.]
MSLSLSEMIIVFFIFSFLGWCMEVILKFIQLHRFVNRGFLVGPYCPIYGFGVVFIIVIIGDILKIHNSIFAVFIEGFIICGILEYVVSYALEKRYHARWWDYSNKPLNINGRVWIGNLCLFGCAAVVIIEVVYPLLRTMLDSISITSRNLIATLILILLFVDCIISRQAMHVIRDEIDGTAADDTEEISSKIHMALKSRSLFTKRLERAYPTMSISPAILVKKLEEAKQKAKEALQEIDSVVEEKKIEVYKNVSQKAETLGNVLSDVSDMDSDERVEFIKDVIDDKKDELKDTINDKKDAFIDTKDEIVRRIKEGDKNAS